ncbi:LEAF RUST 10 DISEASE-RESISTANCE LOCUS RECEPTOR-LIKE PROTEIN KINASE-like 2.1 [Carex rostrata]
MPLFPSLYSLSLSLILLIFIHGTCSTTTSSKSSGSSSRCGNITVTYPFSLYNLDTNSSYYGYPGLRIYCYYDDTPILYLSSANYTVTDISYQQKTISLVDTEILSQSTSTPIVRHNVSFTPYTWLNYTDVVINLTFFLNCPFNSSYTSAEIIPISSILGYSYVFPSTAIPPAINHSKWVDECKEVVIVPVLGNVVNPQVLDLPTTYGSVLLAGFQLAWSNPSDYCVQCEEKGGQCGYNVTSNSTFIPTCFCNNGRCDGAKSHLILGVAIGISLFIGLFAVCICLLFYSGKNKKNWFSTEERKREKLVEVTLYNFGSLAPKRYTFSEIGKITKSFNHKIGQGGYANVFKGNLINGSPVAVKVFKDRESNGVEFTSEVVSIARTSHVNIVRLLGFSMKGSKRALIYEFMSNGSLDKYLRESQNSALSNEECTRRFEITVGIARGLEYLHRGCNTRIVHFDIKPHNILLDQDYCPKISDFGLAKFCQPKESIISMSGMRGTIGYIAPEVFSRNFGVVSSKSDVYSYGMMVLEMFGAKQGKTESSDSTSEIYFPDYIYKCVEQNNICSVYGVSDLSEEIVRKVTIVGLWCIQVMPHSRPTMSAVLDMLDRSIDDLTLPPPLNVSLPPVLDQGPTDVTASISFE